MRKSLITRIIFQVHLWGGLSLGIYALLIGVTGSLLVFQQELAERIAPVPTMPAGGQTATLEQIRTRIQGQSPGWHPFSVEPPQKPGRPWSSFLLGQGKGRMVFADSQGNIIGERNLDGTWLQLVERFHSNLLIPKGGRLYNGIAGLLCAILAITGAILWWPAKGEWSNAFRIVRQSSWKGINYDLHRVGGALLFGFVLLFCITGGYFTWPAIYKQIVAKVLPVNARADANAKINAPKPERLAVDAIVRSAQERVPDGVLLRVLVPQSATQPVRVMFRHGDAHENHTNSQVLVNPYTGEVMAAELYAARQAGDELISLLPPLHTGHFGGLPVKVIWALAGLAMPGLFVTGFLMWWNRVLVPRARRSARASAEDSIAPAAP